MARVHPGRASSPSIPGSRCATSATTRPTPSPAGPGAGCPPRPSGRLAAAEHPADGHFLDHDRLHPAPAGAGPAAGPFGDVWQWTSSAYSPYPGFEPAPGAVGEYNGKFMVNQHVLRGGSCVTPAGHIRATYRNFFPPSARWAFSGLRLARTV